MRKISIMNKIRLREGVCHECNQPYSYVESYDPNDLPSIDKGHCRDCSREKRKEKRQKTFDWLIDILK